MIPSQSGARASFQSRSSRENPIGRGRKPRLLTAKSGKTKTLFHALTGQRARMVMEWDQFMHGDWNVPVTTETGV